MTWCEVHAFVVARVKCCEGVEEVVSVEVHQELDLLKSICLIAIWGPYWRTSATR